MSGGSIASPPAAEPVGAAAEAELAAQLHERLLEMMRRRARSAPGAPPFSDAAQMEAVITELVDSEAAILPTEVRTRIASLVAREALGLGPLEELLSDPEVEEIMVNGPQRVFAERGGVVELTDLRFGDEAELMHMIERILAPLGRRVDELSPMVDARLRDGSRVNVVVPPLAIDGPTISIRRFGVRRLDAEDLVSSGTLTEGQLKKLAHAIRARRSLIVSGGTGSGKTTLLNVLSGLIDDSERIVTIEDAAELDLRQPHVVRLESRPSGIEGRGAVSIRDLLRNALRMRPDRLVIGEVRGSEAFDLLAALNTGHEGTLSTVHANSAADALSRLELLCLTAGVGLPHEAIRSQLYRGVDLIAHLERRSDGSRRLAELVEVGAAGIRPGAPGPGEGLGAVIGAPEVPV